MIVKKPRPKTVCGEQFAYARGVRGTTNAVSLARCKRDMQAEFKEVIRIEIDPGAAARHDDTTASLIAKVKSQALRIAKAEVKAIEVTTQAVEPPTTTWTPDADLEFDAADEDLTGSVCSALSTANVSTIERGMLSRGSTQGSYVSAPSRSTLSDAAGSTPSGQSTPSWLSWALSEAHESKRPSWLVTPPEMKPEEQFRPSWLTTPPASEGPPPAFTERPSAAHRPSEAQLHAEVAELREALDTALERMSEALQTECRTRESLENEVARQGALLLETRELLAALTPSSLPSGRREADEDGDPAAKPAAEPAPVFRLNGEEEEAEEAEEAKEAEEAEEKMKESEARIPNNQPNQPIVKPIETPNMAVEQPVIRRLEPKEEAALLSAQHAAMQQAAAEDEDEAEEELPREAPAEARFENWEAAEAKPEDEDEAEPEVEAASDSPSSINLSSLMSSPPPQQPTSEPIQEPSSGNAFIDFFVNMSPFQQRAVAVEMATPRQLSAPWASPSSRLMTSTATAAFTTASNAESAPRSRPPPDFGGTPPPRAPPPPDFGGTLF